MGIFNSKQENFTENELKEFVELTYFTKTEILKLYDIFCNGESPKEAKHRISQSEACDLPYLECNPFNDRICRVFSSSPNEDGSLSFDDFVDVMNVFHIKAPISLKIEYAFKIYDFNEDDLLDSEDLEVVMERLIGCHDNRSFQPEELEIMTRNIMEEADLDDDGCLSFAEFEHVITKSSDFLQFC